MKFKLQTENTYRLNLIKGFKEILDNTVVISDKLRDFIWLNYSKSNERLFNLAIDPAVGLRDVSGKDCYLEYSVVIEELDKVAIFSDTFKQLIYGNFFALIDSFSPRHLQINE